MCTVSDFSLVRTRKFPFPCFISAFSPATHNLHYFSKPIVLSSCLKPVQYMFHDEKQWLVLLGIGSVAMVLCFTRGELEHSPSNKCPATSTPVLYKRILQPHMQKQRSLKHVSRRISVSDGAPSPARIGQSAVTSATPPAPPPAKRATSPRAACFIPRTTVNLPGRAFLPST